MHEDLKMQTVGDKRQSIELPVRAGTLSDADFNDPQTGLLGVDSANNRFYVRVGTTWKYVSLT